MYAALYSELAMLPRAGGLDELTQDAYSLFYARSAAMGWLTPAVEGATGGQFASASGLRIAESLIPSLSWFGDIDPRLRVPVRVTLDGGADPAIRTAAPGVQQAVREITQDVFTCESVSLADDDQLILDRTPLGDPRAAPAHNGVTFRGTITEWSLDALGWLAAFPGDVSSRRGITTQLMFTAGPTGAPS